MIPFEPSDPFPLLQNLRGTYADAKIHSAKVDHYFGYRYDQIETQIDANASEEERVRRYAGLPIAMMQTPYTELRYILEFAAKLIGASQLVRVVDFGAAYGRMGLVLSKAFPNTEFLGYEIDPERVREANRVLSLHTRFKVCQADITSDTFVIPKASLYFMYDFTPIRQQMEAFFEKFRCQAEGPYLLVCRGRLVNDIIQKRCPWLCAKNEPQNENFIFYSP